MRRRALLDFAVLGLLHESPMHGYELRRRLNAALGAFRALSFGTLYPCLKALLQAGLIVEDAQVAPTGKRPRITYALTEAGRTLLEPLRALQEWSVEHLGDVSESQDAYDQGG